MRAIQQMVKKRVNEEMKPVIKAIEDTLKSNKTFMEQKAQEQIDIIKECVKIEVNRQMDTELKARVFQMPPNI